MLRDLIVLGVGATTPVFMELAIDAGYNIKGLYHYNDTKTGEDIHGYKILGSFDDLFQLDIKDKLFMLSMGDMNIRKTLSIRIKNKGGILPTIIHPTAIISTFSSVSNSGVLIGPYSIIQADVNIGNGVVIRDGSLICHTTKINDYVFIGPQSLIGANLQIDSQTFVGQKALLISGKASYIGKGCLIGAGSVVTKSVESGKIVVGFPAREIKG
jgi:UDP-perosamine 4-acetyltransferase